MMADRSASVNRLHPAISGSVRRQPKQMLDAPSTTHTLMQGVAMGAGADRDSDGVTIE